jgi:hypothetical protein
VQISETCEVERFFFYRLPNNYKRYVGINSQLDTIIEGGSIDIKRLWFADYLEQQSTPPEDTAQVDVIFRIIRRTEVLNQHYGQQKMFECQQITGGKATHLVEKVVYGVELIISMRRALDFNFESKASAEGNIYLAAKAFFQQIIDSKVYHGERPTELDKINCTIFSSIDPGNVKNGTFEVSWKMVRHDISSDSEEKWKPIEFTLKMKFKMKILTQIDARMSSDKKRVERHMTMLEAIIRESNVIAKHPSIHRVPPFEMVMSQFLNLLAQIRKKVQHFYSMFYVKMRSPELFLSEIKPISDLLIEMIDWLMRRRKEIEMMCSLLSDTNLPMADLKTIKKSVSSGKVK